MHRLGATIGGVTLASALLLAPVTALADNTASNEGSGNTINQSNKSVTVNRSTSTTNGSGNFCGNDLSQYQTASSFRVTGRQTNGASAGDIGGNGGEANGGDPNNSGSGNTGDGGEGGTGGAGAAGANDQSQSQTITQTNNVYQALTITCGPDGPVTVQSSNVSAGSVGLPKTGAPISSDLISTNIPSLLGVFAILVSLGLGRVVWLSRAGRLS